MKQKNILLCNTIQLFDTSESMKAEDAAIEGTLNQSGEFHCQTIKLPFAMDTFEKYLDLCFCWRLLPIPASIDLVLCTNLASLSINHPNKVLFLSNSLQKNDLIANRDPSDAIRIHNQLAELNKNLLSKAAAVIFLTAPAKKSFDELQTKSGVPAPQTIDLSNQLHMNWVEIISDLLEAQGQIR